MFRRKWTQLAKHDSTRAYDCFVCKFSDDEYFWRVYDKEAPDIVLAEGTALTQEEATKEVEKWAP